MEEQVVVGLDIGSTKVCAVVGRLNAQGTLDLLGAGRADSKGVAKGMVLNVNKTTEAVSRAIEQAGNQANYDIGSVMASVGGQHIQCLARRGSLTRDTMGSEVLYDDVARMASDVRREPVAAGTKVLHVLPQEYTVDTYPDVYDPVGVTGMRLQANFQVITTPIMADENARKAVERTHFGLEVDKLVLASLAAGAATLTDDEKEAGVALVDLGGGTTDVVIYHKNIIRHVAVIPYAGNIITADIQQGCNLASSAHTELLKIKYGCALHNEIGLHEVVAVPGMTGRPPKDVSLKNLAIIIEERLKEIAALVCAEIVRSGYENKLSGGIVLTGGTAQFAYIDRLFAHVSGKDVRVGLPNQYFGKGKLDVAENPQYATAVGLVWLGFRALDDRDNDYATQREPLAAPPHVQSNGIRKGKEEKPPKEEKTPGRGFFGMIRDVLSDDIGDKDRYQ